jgi:arginyl-tRNA synthetase
LNFRCSVVLTSNIIIDYMENDEGRQIMWAEGCKIPLTVIKSDGGFTYDTSDMACVKYRVEEEKGDWLIYVVDAGQVTVAYQNNLAANLINYSTPAGNSL